MQPAISRGEIIFSVAFRILAIAKHALAAETFFERDVDHAGNSVRAILRRRTIAQHLNVVDGEQGHRIHVGTRIAAISRTENIYQRYGMAAFAINQHQRLIGAQPAQRGGINQIGTIGTGLACGIERRRYILQRLREIELPALFGDFGHRNKINRHGCIGGRRIDAARADDIDGVDYRGFVGFCGRRLG